MDRSTVVAQTETVTKRWGHMSWGTCLYYMGQGMPGMVRMASWLGARAPQLLLEPQADSSVGCLSEGSSLSSGSHSGSFPDHHKSSTKMK